MVAGEKGCCRGGVLEGRGVELEESCVKGAGLEGVPGGEMKPDWVHVGS